MPTRAQTKRKPPTKAAEEVTCDATEPAEELATKAELKQLEDALRADFDLLAERLLDLTARLERTVRRRRSHNAPMQCTRPLPQFRSSKELAAEVLASTEDVHVERLAEVPAVDLSSMIRSEAMLMTLDDACSSVG